MILAARFCNFCNFVASVPLIRPRLSSTSQSEAVLRQTILELLFYTK